RQHPAILPACPSLIATVLRSRRRPCERSSSFRTAWIASFPTARGPRMPSPRPSTPIRAWPWLTRASRCSRSYRAMRRRRGRARETVTGATGRERQQVEALGALIAGETTRGLALVDEHVAEFPRDAIAVHQAGNAIALAGGSDREAYRVAFMERLAPAYGDD